MPKSSLIFISVLTFLATLTQGAESIKHNFYHKKSRASVTTTTNLKICALRVSFPNDADPGTTGNGQFLNVTNTPCSDFVIDPPPHNRAYFLDHLRALNNYYSKVSHGKVTIDTVNSQVFPIQDDSTYTVPHRMAYYHPFLQKDSIDLRLAELFYDAIQAADSEVDFRQYDVVVVFHAGVGQDFDLFLDPTPYDIPSVFINRTDLKNLLAPDDPNFVGIAVENGNYHLDRGLILPETQNHLLFDNWQEVFGSGATPCEYQIGLNGTFAFIFGFYLGLPALYDTQTGTTGIGKFGLMDQGSANLNGLVPAVPSAWERFFMGWEEPIESPNSATIHLSEVESGSDTTIWKVTLNASEYFLIENRCAHVRPGVSLDSIQYQLYLQSPSRIWPSLFPLLRDSLRAVFSPNTGVMLRIPKYDYGLPGSGLLIWHIDESIIQSNLANNQVNINRDHRGVDLEEGDGAQDLGYDAGILGANINIGWYFDPWFAGNEGFFHLNPDYPRDAAQNVGFTPFTNPATTTNAYLYTGVSIDSIGPAGSVMSFCIRRATTPEKFPLNFPTTITHLLPLSLNMNRIPDAFLVCADSAYIFNAEGHLLSTAVANTTYAINGSQITGFQPQSGDDLTITTWQIDSNGKWQVLAQTNWQKKNLYGQPLPIGKGIIYCALATDVNQYELGYYLPQSSSVQSVYFSTPIVRFLGDSTFLYGITDANELFRIQPQPFGVTSLGQLANIGRGEHLLVFIDSNELPDLLHYYNGNLKIIFDLDESQKTVTRDIVLSGDLACADIDGDGKNEIIAYDANAVYAFNQDLKFKYNFPISLPNILKGDEFSSNLRLSDLDGDGIKDVLLTTQRGVVAFNKQGRLIANFPLNFVQPRAGSGILINSAGGQLFLGVTQPIGQSDYRQISGALLAATALTSTDWVCQGGDASRRYFYPVLPTTSGKNARGLLNHELTFNWPNPARDNRTFIRYFVNSSCKINIDIYDLAGDLITSFEDNHPRSGDYNEKEWYVGEIKSGVYFAVVKASVRAQTDTKIIKIIVIK